MEKLLLLLLFLVSCVETGGLSPGEQQDLVIPLNFKNGKVRNSGFLLGKVKKVDALISKVSVQFQVENQTINRDAEISSGCEFCDQGEVGLKVKLPNNKDDGVFLKKRRSYKVSIEVFDDKNFSLAKKSFEITKVGTQKDYNNDGFDDLVVLSMDMDVGKSNLNVFLGGQGETLDSTSDFELLLDGGYMSGENHF